jgi:hypothetical protein
MGLWLSMNVDYKFEFADGEILTYEVDLNRHLDKAAYQKDTEIHPEPWTKLGYCKCVNCPLKADEPYCPVALDTQKVVNDFRNQKAFQKVNVTVVTTERTYVKYTGLEEGLRSLMGLIMATSSCPILAKLRPMAINHMPFSSENEFILRSVSTYLLQQYFTVREGGKPDWELKGLIELNKSLQLVNQALWQRIHTACESDSNLKALLSFFSMASSVSFSLESQLIKLKHSLEMEEKF